MNLDPDNYWKNSQENTSGTDQVHQEQMRDMEWERNEAEKALMYYLNDIKIYSRNTNLRIEWITEKLKILGINVDKGGN